MTENFTKVPNDIVAALARLDLSNNEFRVVLAILRQTVGFHIHQASIPHKIFRKITGLDNSNITRTRNRLVERGVVGYTANKLYSISSSTYDWKSLAIPPTVGDTAKKKKPNRQQPLAIPPTDSDDTKETIKETIKRKVSKESKPPNRNNPINQLQDYFKDNLDKILDNPVLSYPTAGRIFKGLLATQTIDEIKVCIDAYFKTKDKFYIDSGYDIRWFGSKYNSFKPKKGVESNGTWS